jgi:hypothetical protein
MKATKAIEKAAPWIACGTAFATHALGLRDLRPESNDLFGNVVNISGIAIGFLATGQALLCSLSDNFVVQTLRKLGRFEDMLRFFSSAIHWCLVLAIVSLLAYWIQFKDHPILFSAWLGVFAGAGVSTVRILILFNGVLHGRNA